jgi:hypothetical protein
LAGKYTESCSSGTDGSAFILKTDSEGNQEWIKVFSNCTLYSVQQTSDGGYVAAGVKNENAWLVKLAGYGKGVEDKKAPVSCFSQIRNYNFDIFHWIFHWNHFW